MPLRRRRKLALLSSLAFALFGCGAVANAPPAPVAGAPTTSATVPPTTGARDPIIDAYLAGDLDGARVELEKRVAADPTDLRATALLRIVNAETAARTTSIGKSLTKSDIVTIEPFDGAARAGSVPLAATPTFALELASTTKLATVDDGDWLERHELTSHVVRPRSLGREIDSPVDPTTVPDIVAASIQGQRLQRVFQHADHAIGVYGDFFQPGLVAVFAKNKQPRVYNTRKLSKLPVQFAELVGDTLVLCLWRNGYAKNVEGKNGYLVAIDPSGSLLWASDPLVADSEDLEIVGSHAIVAYGFTREDGHISVVDLTSGKVESSMALSEFPTHLIRKGNEVYVRTQYNEMTLRIPSDLPGAPPASLADARATRAPIDAGTRAKVGEALDALAARDATHLGKLVDDFGAAHVLPQLLVDGLRAEKESIDREVRGEGVDLTRAPLVRVGEVPWTHSVSDKIGAEKPKSRVPGLSETGHRPPLANPFPAPPIVAGQAFVLAPIDRGALPKGAPEWIPSHYGLEDLYAAVPYGDATMLVYGGRYVVSVRAMKAERAFDLDALRHAPNTEAAWAKFAVEDVTDAKLRDGVLYVANGGGSYAKEVHGLKGFVTALDYATGEWLWRSEALVSDAPFAFIGDDYIVSAYGFTDEPSEISVLARATGETMSRSKLSTIPRWLELDGNRVTIEGITAGLDLTVR